MLKQNHAFGNIYDIIISVIVGATVLHEVVGPVFLKTALKKAGEIEN